MNFNLLSSAKIDSIRITDYSSQSAKIIPTPKDTLNFASFLKKSVPVKIKAPNISKLVYQVVLYLGPGKMNLDFYDYIDDGRAILCGRVDYRNDKIWDMVDELYRGKF